MMKQQDNWRTASWRVAPPMCACDPQPCEHAGLSLSGRTFELFRHQNSNLQYSSRPACPREILDAGHECSYEKGCFSFHPGLLDHHETARFPDGQHVIISHPYVDRSQSWPGKPEGLAVRTSDPEQSWFNPGMTRLVLIGAPEALERVNLDYEVN